MQSGPILVLGATGYVGSRLVPRLLDWGFNVRAAARSIEKLALRPWANHPRVELTAADARNPGSLKAACTGCSAVYYLIHSPDTAYENFSEIELETARNIVKAAEETGIERLIYLDWLGETDGRSSPHLRSRAEIRGILQSGKVPATFLRTSLIIGSGSVAFEILRYVTERCPVILAPKWFFTRFQPIAIRNILDYLTACLRFPETAGQTYDIGGPNVLTFRDLIELYTAKAKLRKRMVLRFPDWLASASSWWVQAVTPIPSSLAKPVIENLQEEALCREKRIERLTNQKTFETQQALHLAFEQSLHNLMDDTLKDHSSIPPPEWSYAGDPPWAGGVLYEISDAIVLRTSPEEIWRTLVRIGGKTGWYYANWLWQLRGLLDKITGGVGMRKEHPKTENLNPGDIIDCFRVGRVKFQSKLVLVSELKLPGSAVLDFRITRIDNERTKLHQSARFIPRGVRGMLYWHTTRRLHKIVFKGLLRGIAKKIGKPVLSWEK